ncbi:MAG TPA: methyltransferase [Bdellovibrionales bacterium]|nr:methyltransferase [Bdellovibrionales bacterium]
MALTPCPDRRTNALVTVESGFTYEYSQPDEYHFCQDSVIAPWVIAQDLPSDLSADLKVLDVCAGCGVFGFELAFHRTDIAHIDFLEVQSVFQPHFARNAETVRAARGSGEFRFIQDNYRELAAPVFAAKYDLVIANPPYFHSSEGSLTAEPVKTRARFFMDASFQDLVSGVVNSLKPSGFAYLLVKSGDKHDRDHLMTIKSIAWNREVRVIADVRGTNLVRIGQIS